MLLFFSIIIFFIIVFIIIKFSTVKIKIENLEFYKSINKKMHNYKLKVGLYLFGRIKLVELKIDEKKKPEILQNSFVKGKLNNIKNVRKDNTKVQKKEIERMIKFFIKNVDIDKLKLQLYIDCSNVLITSYLIGIVSIIIPNILRNKMKNTNDYNFSVLPVYKNEKSIYVKLSSIISIKVVHIINMFKLIGGIKHERTSNRRLNVDCYGKY